MSERIWGPDFDEYSAQNFKPQGSDVPMSKIEFFDINGQFREVPPLALIETSLSRCDPRIYGTVSLNLNIVSTALVEYSLANDVRNIFQHYYGFLCVRYLLHITCLAALGPTRHAVNKILNTLPQDASWEELCKIISIEALDKASQAMRNPTSFNEFCRVFDDNRFSGSFEDDSPKELYIALTATLLWGDRDLFFTLCQRDLLPGSTLLLVVALELALSGSVKETTFLNNLPSNSSYETLVRLKELAFRAYLAGSYQERQILPIACMPIIEKEKPEDYEPDYFVNSEDGQKISRAYFNLLPRWRQDKSEAENIPRPFKAR
ncbi:hypothetical protein FRC09_015195 [Ceratobasidium sp. 395]|nr:hypothetical protein FRC09_015195 [Ceratobasidium sp. 395]